MSGHTSEPIDTAVLLRYVSDQASPDERRQVDAWLAADEANRAELTTLARAWRLAAGPMPPAFDIQALWARIRPQLDDAPAPAAPAAPTAPAAAPRGAAQPTHPTTPRAHRASRLVPPSTRPRWARAAARVGGVLALAVAAFLLFRPAAPDGAAGGEPAMRTYATRAGERTELELADGTKAVLGGGTTLRIPETFGAGARDVYLDGAAYFEVVHDEANVFRVHTSRLVAEDLGTRFTVVAYASDTIEQVAVSEGIVGVAGSDRGAPVRLEPNDVAHVSATGVVSATRNVAVGRYFSWIDGEVQFDQTRLSDAVRILGRQFGIEVRIADSALAARRFSGAVRAATLYEDLRGLALLLDADFESRGRTVTLSSRDVSAR